MLGCWDFVICFGVFYFLPIYSIFVGILVELYVVVAAVEYGLTFMS